MKRRRRHDRRKRILTHRRENAIFYARGTFPPSASAMAVCGCGGRAFERAPVSPTFHADFYESHAYCSDEFFDSNPEPRDVEREAWVAA